MIREVALWFGVMCLGFTIAQYATMVALAWLSGRLFRKHRAARRPVAVAKASYDRRMPGVSIIMPAYNEAAIIVHSVTSALEQHYPDVEVIVVNDGSKDATMQVLIDHFGLEVFHESPPAGQIPTERVRAVYRSRADRRIIVVDKEPSGSKADGSNAGLNMATKPWCVVMDADEFMERDAIARCMVEVAADPENVVAVGGTLLPANDILIDGPNIVERHTPQNYWVRCQLIEYLTAFLIARPGLADLNALPIVSGGYGMFRTSSVREIAGYRHGHLGEDMDLMVRLHRHAADHGGPGRVAQVPESLCWTEFPSSYAVLRRQRIRWHRGLKTIMDDHRDMIGRRRYGSVGSIGIGSLYVFEWIGPLLEATGWLVITIMLALGWINPTTVVGTLLVTQLAGCALTVLAVVMSSRHLSAFTRTKDVWRLLWSTLLFNWGYRQLSLWWRIRSLLPGAAGWGEMTRAGIKTATPAPSPAGVAVPGAP